MGVCGSGKSTVGAALAHALGAVFLEGDAFHPPANVARMAAGVALTDADREGWLAALGARLAQARRDGEAGELALIHLAGASELLAQRMAGRQGHYMPASLLASQLATLQPPQPGEHALSLDVAHAPHELVQQALAWLRGRTP